VAHPPTCWLVFDRLSPYVLAGFLPPPYTLSDFHVQTQRSRDSPPIYHVRFARRGTVIRSVPIARERLGDGSDVSIEQREKVWARDYLTDRVKLLPHRAPKISSTFILEHVAFMHNLSAEQILATRQKPRVTARHVAMYLAREITDESSTQIARAFRKRDHTTILYGTRRISDRIAIEPRFAQEVDLLRRLISESFAAYCAAFAQQRAS
jgi:hypothetical protein